VTRMTFDIVKVWLWKTCWHNNTVL